jgi:hypothetical protein
LFCFWQEPLANAILKIEQLLIGLSAGQQSLHQPLNKNQLVTVLSAQDEEQTEE